MTPAFLFTSMDNVMTQILVEFSGWCLVDPAKVKFACVGEELPDIDGFQWLGLDAGERNSYILDSVTDVQQFCEEGSYDQIDVTPYTQRV